MQIKDKLKRLAKLLINPPLEIGNNSSTAHLQRIHINTVRYTTPQETSNMGDGHYVIFDVLSHNKSAYKTSTFDNGRLNKVGR